MSHTSLPHPLGRLLVAAATAVTIFAGSAAAAATPPGSDADTVFPVTVVTKFGEIEVPAAPQRVVSVGYTDQDYLLALGVVPVGIREWYGEQPYATWPWAQDELGDATPEVLAADALNFEAIAGLEPDLIIAVGAGLTPEEYASLSVIAPTITAGPDSPQWGIPWRDGFLQVAAAVGKTADAEAIVAGIDAKFEAARTDHPEFAGLTGAVAFWWQDQPGAYATADPRSEFLVDLGFVIPAAFDELAGDSFYTSFSAEQIELLDVDVLVWVAASDTELAPIEESPLLDTLAVRQEGREVMPDETTVAAFSFNTPLSVDYLFEHLVPQLADAAASAAG